MSHNVGMTKESELLVTHLSKEIEMANAQLIEQRTKNNLWVAFGPFLILGGIAANQGALEALRQASGTCLLIVGGASLFSYVGLGWIAAEVEKQIWGRANKCRELLAEHTQIQPASIVFPIKGLRLLYMIIFGALGGVFVGLGWVLHSFK